MDDPDPESTKLVAQLLLIAILTLLNAFFAASEIAILSLNKNKIKLLAEGGSKKAKLLEKLTEEPTKFLSTVQVGITLAGFLSSASAATGISKDLGQFLSNFKVPYAEQAAVVAVTIILSYFTLVFGELYPKRVALYKAEAIAMFAASPIMFISKLTAPFVKLLSLSTTFLLKITGINDENLEEKISKEEIRAWVEVGEEHGVINETEKDMINSIFEFDDKLAEEVMTPRTEVYMINVNKPLNEYLDELLEEKYSRMPVYEGDSDNIIGVLYMKDFLVEARKVGFENVEVRDLLHTAYFVPEKKNIDELFKELQATKKHMAILIDEYGGFSGVVTIEDLIEEVMGKIEDEYDNEEPDIVQQDNNTFIINGLLSIKELSDSLNLDLDVEAEDYDTVSGLVVKQMGHIPATGNQQIIEYENMIFKILEVKENRIKKVQLTI
ncbi:MAG: CBS/transporter-associated domain protein [Clostridia bacterium]|jgi:putative hemolysin|nr:CBS/transporter-associated domain protein [Clostridia bacterium]